MAYPVDIFFSGLMIICLAGQVDWPTGENVNTAWIVKAEGPQRVCGWLSEVKSDLILQFSTDDFKYDEHHKERRICRERTSTVECRLPAGQICLVLDAARQSPNTIEDSLKDIPRLPEIDERFDEIRSKRLLYRGWVPTRIHFPLGKIGAGDIWTVKGKPVLWRRSNGVHDEYLPRYLSDRLKASYAGVASIALKMCDAERYMLTLTPKRDNGRAVFQNRANRLPYYSPEGLENLTYLLWNYRLGAWKPNRAECPQYTYERRDAVLLSCNPFDECTPCAMSTDGPANTTFWPPMLGSRY